MQIVSWRIFDDEAFLVEYQWGLTQEVHSSLSRFRVKTCVPQALLVRLLEQTPR
jgi:hypothetical protein